MFGVTLLVEIVDYTKKQGQYLSFIYSYIKLNKRPPAHRDFQIFFRLDPASVNSMLKTLEKKRFIARQKGKPRSIQLLLKREELPDLD